MTEQVKFVAQCLDCRGKPYEADSPTEREVWVRDFHPDHSVHLWISGPTS